MHCFIPAPPSPKDQTTHYIKCMSTFNVAFVLNCCCRVGNKDWGTGVVEGVFNLSLHGEVLTKWIFLQLFSFLLKTRG